MTSDPGVMHARPRPTPLLPPVVFLLYNGLLIALDKLAPLVHWVPSPWHWLGLIPVTLGTAVAVVGLVQFRRHRTTLRPFHHSSALVTGGLYRRSRNPMYLGLVVVMVGIAWLAGSASVWLVPPLLAFTLWARFIRHEEAMLAERFGPAYAAYRERVRRWV